jgi:hypothetical protein
VKTPVFVMTLPLRTLKVSLINSNGKFNILPINTLLEDISPKFGVSFL